MVNQDDVLFCEVAVRLGKATKSQVEQALCRKADLEVQGYRFRIGEVLSALGLIDRGDIDVILEVQSRELFSCGQCGSHFLIGSLKAGSRVKCGKCGMVIVVPEKKVAPAPVPSGSDPAAVPADPAAPAPAGAGRRIAPTTRLRVSPAGRKAGLGSRLGVGPAEKEGAAEDQLVGTVLARCTLSQRLGVGGWGAVYRARHQVTGKDFAIKVLSPALATWEEHVQRFYQEAKLTAQLSHPAIRQVFDAGVERSLHFMVMEYVDGNGLKTLVEQNDPYDPESAVRIMLQVVSGLSLAAEAGITHRDLKPQNILIDRQGRAKITDFGLAKASHESAELTATGSIIGTPEYMAPEQFEGRPSDVRSDIYSLGCTFFYMLTGRPPFEGKDLFTLMNKHRNEPPPSPRKYNSRIPYALCRALSKMLEKRQENRYPDYPALVLDLQTPGATGAVAVASPEPAAGVEDGSPLQRWMTEERMNQCTEIQSEFVELGFVPPAAAEILPRLGIETGMAPRETDSGGGDPVLACGRCNRKTAFTRAVAEGGFWCACRGPLRFAGAVSLVREQCYVIAGPADVKMDAAVMGDLVSVCEHALCKLGFNVVVDLKGAEARSAGDVNAFAASLQRLMDVPGAVLLATGEGKLRESLIALGIGEFLRVLDPGRPFAPALETAAVCPHAQEGMGLLRGLAGYSEAEFPDRIGIACAPCPRGERFQEFYIALPDLVRKGSLDGLRAAYDGLLPELDAPCMKEAAARVHRRAEEGIRIGLDKRGREYLRQGDRAKAERYAGMLLRHFPKHAASHDLAGCVALAQKAYGEAGKAFTRAIELAEEPREFLLNRATTLQAAGDRSGALRDLDAVVKKDPGDILALLRRGLLQLDMQAYAEAGKDFDRAVALAPDSPAALNGRGKLRHRAGNLKGAVEDFEAASKLDPTDATYHANCGALLVKLNELDRATRHLERALDLQPALSTPRYNLACIAARHGDAPRAMELLEAAVAGGFTRADVIRGDADLAPLRALPGFAAVLKQAESARAEKK